jgi:putative transposase
VVWPYGSGMNPPRCTDRDYIDFLIATPKAATATEAARVQPDRPDAPAHDAFTRLLHRLEPDPVALWEEVRPLVRKADGVLVLDDSVLDKPFARHMGLVGYHWSGRHKRVVRGIDLVTLLWTDGDGLWPCDYRLVNPAERVTKNDHFRELVRAAKARGFAPRCVVFDAWYSGKDNLKAIRDCGWVFLTQVRCNRRVNPDRSGNRPIRDCAIAATGTVVHLEGFGLIRAFRIVTKNGDTEHWITNDLGMDEGPRVMLAEWAWGIEEYHRGLKQHCGVDRCQTRMSRAQRVHIGCALRAFVRLEWHRFTTGVSWFAAKLGIIRDAVRGYLTCPRYCLPEHPTA